ncbi:MAG: hypothetical protein R2800_08405 [Flavipsychrobacter sp.]
MLNTVSKKIVLFSFLGFFSMGIISSCIKEGANSDVKAKATISSSARYNDPYPHKLHHGVRNVDMNNQVTCALSCLNCLCHIEESGLGQEYQPGDPGVVYLELTDANKVKAVNTSLPTTLNLSVSASQPLPSSFAIGAGYSAIHIQPGTYAVQSDPGNPNGYYLFDVVLVP